MNNKNDQTTRVMFGNNEPMFVKTNINQQPKFGNQNTSIMFDSHGNTSVGKKVGNTTFFIDTAKKF